jgi:uncharacterized protein YciI
MKPMRSIYKTLLIASLLIACVSCEQQPEEKEAEQQKGSFDPVLAEKYGADEYGMKKYVFAFLKRGPNQELDSVRKAELQMAHLKNINRMAEEGKLVLAGPFFGNDDLRGIYVFNVGSIAEAEELTGTDPSIQAGLLTMELKEWYGSAALVGVNEIHESLMKKDIVPD